MNRTLSVRVVFFNQSISSDQGTKGCCLCLTSGTSTHGGRSMSRRADGER